MRGQQAGRAFVLIAFGLTSYLLYLIASPFLPALAWAAFLAIAFHPVYKKATKLFRGREMLAAIATTLCVTALILLPAVYLVGSLASAAISFFPELEDQFVSARAAAGAPGAHPSNEAVVAGVIAGVVGVQPDTPEKPSGQAGDETVAPVEEQGGADAVTGAQGKDSAQAGAPGKESAPGKLRIPFLEEVEARLSRYIDMEGVDLEAYALTALNKLASFVAQRTGSWIGNALSLMTTFILSMFLIVVFLLQGPALIEFAGRFMPLSAEDRKEALGQLHDMTGAIFYGVMMTAAIQAVVGAIGWRIAGLPSPVVFGVAMFFCALLPLGGSGLIWGPGGIWLMIQGHYVAGIFLLIWGALAVGMLDNVLRPIFISGRSKVPMVPVLLAIFGGVAAFGMTGLFVGPLAVTLFLFLLEIIRRDVFGIPDAPPPSGSGNSTVG